VSLLVHDFPTPICMFNQLWPSLTHCSAQYHTKQRQNKAAASHDRLCGRFLRWGILSTYLSIYRPEILSHAGLKSPLISRLRTLSIIEGIKQTTRETLQNPSNCKPLENISVHCGDIDWIWGPTCQKMILSCFFGN